MPIHDWTMVTAGTFHDFHQTWIIEIKRALNSGRLPDGYYAMAEQVAGGWEPDVLTLEGPSIEADSDEFIRDTAQSGARKLVVAERPPRVKLHVKAEVELYADKADRIAIRHSSNHKVVAVIEVVSPGNKFSRQSLSKFIEKATDLLVAGVHLLVIDLIPPGSFDRNGMHGVLWKEYTSEPYSIPENSKLTLASYIGGGVAEAYVEPTAVGEKLVDMPLFLDANSYVPVPLEETYESAFRAVPSVWRKVLSAN